MRLQPKTSFIDTLSVNRTLGLSIYRVILSFLVLKNCIFYIPNAAYLFGPNAIVSFQTYVTTMTIVKVGYLVLPFNYAPFSVFLLIVTAILAAFFLLGIFGRIAGIALFFCLFSLNMRNEFILDGSDNVIAVTLPFLIFSNSYQYFTFSFSQTVKPVTQSYWFKNIMIPVMAFAVLGFLIQITYVYFFTALHKLQGKSWLNGTAIYYTMRVQDFNATRWNIPLTKNHYFVVLGTYFTVIWELSFAFLVWFRQTKYFVLFFGVVLHLGIWIFMRIDNFSWIMIGSYFVFITDNEYARIKVKLISFNNWFLRLAMKKKPKSNMIKQPESTETYS